MAHFIKLALADLNEDGEPLISIDESWINIDQITEITTMLGNNLFRRHAFDSRIAAEYYPLVRLSFSDTDNRLLSLGIHPTPSNGLAAIETFMPTLLNAKQNHNIDTEFAHLLGSHCGSTAPNGDTETETERKRKSARPV